LAAGERLTSWRCDVEFAVTRDTAVRDFGLLIKRGLAVRQRRGGSTSYVFAPKPEEGNVR
jgi:hypothetical protein